jgi:transcriptional regulator with XRE-family HTH domain
MGLSRPKEPAWPEESASWRVYYRKPFATHVLREGKWRRTDIVCDRRISMRLTPAQSRAARGLLDWSQSTLGACAHLSESTIRDFEKGRRVPSINNLIAIQRALEAAGVEFTNDGGPGVRMSAHPLPSPGSPSPRGEDAQSRLAGSPAPSGSPPLVRSDAKPEHEAAKSAVEPPGAFHADSNDAWPEDDY